MKKYKFDSLITILFVSFFLASCASTAETGENETKQDAAPPTEIIAQADALFRQREDISKLREAVRLLAAARNPGNRSYEVEWKFAKYSYFLGRQSDDEEESEKALDEGEHAGRIASRIAPDKPDGYFWYGANLGEQAKESPITVGIQSVDDIREAMHKVMEIQPDYQGASAYVALGQIELVTGLIGGNPKKAIEYLEKGLEIEKNNAYLRLHLAEAYIATNRRADAKKQLEAILKMQPHPDYVVEHKEASEKAKKLLETRF